MPKLTRAIPKYRKHATGQALVQIDGKRYYLGKWGTPESRAKYDRLVSQYLADRGDAKPRPTAVAKPTRAHPLTIAEVCLAYWRHAEGYYIKDGQPTDHLATVKRALHFLRVLFADTAAEDFGPLRLQEYQSHLVERGASRPYVNGLTGVIRRLFKWAVAQELVPPSVHHGLQAVPGLRKGRTAAREPAPILPVDDAVVEETLPHLGKIVADMVTFQRLTGARPGEVCIIRPCDVDRGGDVWAYVPASHKTEHHDRGRVILIGPKAQAVLRPYLLRPAQTYCFSPSEAVEQDRRARHAARKTPLSCGNIPGSNRVRYPKWRPGERYDVISYRRAITRAIVRANAVRREKAKTAGEQNWERLPSWSPNQLRHAAATEVRRRFGLEASQVVLGHARADVTQVYAERDLSLARRVVAEVG